MILILENDMSENFINYLSKTLRFSSQTCHNYNYDAIRFVSYLTQQGLALENVKSEHIQNYINLLQRDKLLASKTLARYLKSIEHYFNFLIIEGNITVSPMLNYSYPKHFQPIHHFYTSKEMSALLAAPDTTRVIGIRNRAILEILYNTGLRGYEVTLLKLYDIDFINNTALVNGKGSHERIVPLNQAAVAWLNRYLNVRDKLLKNKVSESLFLSTHSTKLTQNGLYRIVKKYVRKAKLNDSISPHTLRHCFGSHMLQNGANIEIIRDLLGHESIQTTQIYTQIDNERLMQLHQKHHPRS